MKMSLESIVSNIIAVLNMYINFYSINFILAYINYEETIIK